VHEASGVDEQPHVERVRNRQAFGEVIQVALDLVVLGVCRGDRPLTRAKAG
jgi:hypothetical protein